MGRLLGLLVKLLHGAPVIPSQRDGLASMEGLFDSYKIFNLAGGKGVDGPQYPIGG
jgi:hypothetical protein